ncbi:C40 family peptidase [Chishuiella sp.]|uniref:C40 family peptidase n=1 Tax=Chishuiella sp. TaxID=1969467 RepID=UPI0028B19F5C|nr:C40 family peptidase [Chishuiella sp.]
MKKNVYILLLIVISTTFLFSCGSSKKVTSYKRANSYKKTYTYKSNNSSKNNSTIYHSKNSNESVSRDANRILRTAKSYMGTPYKFGGTTNTGLDCSGLVYLSFMDVNIQMPRISRDQANSGRNIDIENVKIGDLIFFNTSGNAISHVGIVESIKNNGTINFIHSSTSKGVMISSLDEDYWKIRFVKATRLL